MAGTKPLPRVAARRYLREVRLFLAAFAAACVLAPAAAQSQTVVAPPPGPPREVAPPARPLGPFGWGLSEPSGAALGDRRVRKLGVGYARVIVPYDLVPRALGPGRTRLGRYTWREFYAWLRAVRRQRLEPMVTFQKQRPFGRRRHLPSLREYERATQRFMERFPAIRTYTAWNEPNDAGQPTLRSPARAAEYWASLQARCTRCVVAAGDLLDNRLQDGYLAAYRARLAELGLEPTHWAYHAYNAGVTRRAGRLGAFLAATPAESEVWLTEQGGIVRSRGIRSTPRRANEDLRFLVGLPALSPRIRRFYLYQLRPSPTWDSALFDEAGRARGMFHTFRRITRSVGRP